MKDHFGPDVAASYDDSTNQEFSPEVIDRTVDFLASRCDGGTALEFAIGTGRIGIPLSDRGISVVGIDLSDAMVARLHTKPGGDAIETVVGDFTSTSLDRQFSLVYLVFNTIMNVTTQSRQVATFRNAAAHLDADGKFVVEVAVPALRRLAPGHDHVVFDASERHWGIDEYDVVDQALVSHHITIEDGGEIAHTSLPFRYVWPSELDLMAEMAGMALVERYADWDQSPFTADSCKHVSVWARSAS